MIPKPLESTPNRLFQTPTSDQVTKMPKRRPASASNSTRWERIVTTGVAVWIVILVTFLLIRNEPFRDPNLIVVLRALLSLSVAALGATIPGFLNVGFAFMGWTIRAGGALALFAITYFGCPTVLTSLRPISHEVLGPSQYPSETIIAVVPTKAELAAKPHVPAEKVTLSYKNETKVDLKLFVYDFSKKNRPASDPFAPKIYWEAWPLPADENFHYFSDFKATNGWFGFVVGHFNADGQSLDSYFLTSKNIFYSESPSLTVVSTSNRARPFAAEFGAREGSQ